MPLRCVYTDLDGTLLGQGGSLFRDSNGGFSLMQARALEACHRAGVEVVLKSGRREAQVMEDARLIGQSAYIYEAGCVLVMDGERTYLTGDLVNDEDGTIHEKIEASGAPRLLLETFAGRLEYHRPWHTDREISHLFRGLVDAAETERLLAQHGHGHLRLVDNGAISRSMPGIEHPHAYHLIPREASKARAVVAHMRARGYPPESCIAVGDSREDLDVAPSVGRFFLVANAVERDPSVSEAASGLANVEITEGRMGEGFYEAVVRTLAETR
jgi:hydroxymethylpyrimidine pyrophosphatase-like HAD family hydrolase